MLLKELFFDFLEFLFGVPTPGGLELFEALDALLHTVLAVDFVVSGAYVHCIARLLLLSHHFPNRETCKDKKGEKENQYLDGQWESDKDRNNRQDWNKCVLPLTQDEVILRQLCISDLFVQGAAGVEIHVSHEAAAVEFLLDLPH